MGPAFAFMAACAFGLGTVLQQKGTLDTTSGRGDSRWLIQILHEPVWLAGGLLQASGWILQAVALDKGPLMAVQAITTLSLVIALPFGAWLTHQHVDRTVVLGAVAAARQWRRRDRPRTGSGVAKKFTARLKELNPWEAATVGVLEQPWTLTAAAAVVLVRHHSAFLVVVFAFVAFALLSTATVGLIFLYFARRPGQAEAHLSDLRDRLVRAGPAVFAIVSVAVGVFLIIDGVTGIVRS